VTTEAEALAEITAGLAKAVGSDCGLGKKVKFDFGSAGVVMIDATSVPNVVCNADEAADCTLRQTLEDFVLMSQGKLDSTAAFMQGRLKVDGDMSIAMRLDSVLKG
jgi:putative sterol carrier protein